MLETNELINQIGSLSYLGIWGVSIISNIIIPVPEEVVLLVLGYISNSPKINIFILFPVVVSGLLVSDIAMYFLSKKGNKLVKIFYEKVFSSQLEPRREWLGRHINKVIFFSRFLVQLRFLGPFLAGQTGISFKRFLLLDLGAIVVYTLIYLSIGWYFKSRIEYIASGINLFKNILIVVALVALAIGVMRLFRRLLLGKKIK